MSGTGNQRFSASDFSKSAFGELSVQSNELVSVGHFPYNINTDLMSTSTTGSGSVSHSGQLVTIASGAASSSSGVLSSKKVLEYQPGMGGLIRFTAIYTTGVAGNTQFVGAGNANNGLFFGYNGTSFGINRRSGGSDNFTAQSSWNIDKMDGTGPSGMTLDLTKGNVFQIKFQWLGFGAISFFVENQYTGALILVHRIEYSNSNTNVALQNPSLPYRAESTNTTNDTSITIKVASFGLYLEGKRTNAGNTINAIDNTKTISTLASVLSIGNKTTYQSVSNSVQVTPKFLSLSADGAQNVSVKVYVNASLGGVPAYSDISTNTSVVEYDTAGTTISNGTLILTPELAKNGNVFIDLTPIDLILSPGDTFTVAATSSVDNAVSAGITWAERFS